ncbi:MULTISPECIES: ATP-dependent helicase HrpB [unclassified Paenibacillus]|uniref:ATP-dependent helicase HrpB n=1 Tax=unclassified Paenibacillus TaxID=185978 RepID=UPI001AEA0E65|nr:MULTISPECIES: ATP-dependent helicase HrpB [unclassified Paenibacillus]MBP1155912.1 ATP-dependent helicase HrpB [Paenibacillus sp. PvP091]MBP1168702.1 ATP-dependent helicase HrpB [Paenibacillus sp. PvR098]MBP2439730.1 ATP-dependent helicase HrpB [Paenibacillus sp. PvP052]
MLKLPVESVLPELKDKLRTHNNAVLIAAPGAGKTTRVPLELFSEPWLEDRKIVMLEPRRLAARAAARFMAALLGEQVGETVGYRVRSDTKVSAKTRIEVMTEGVLTRLLQCDPALEDVGLVIFDEYHERSLQADLGLALCLEAQAVLREDLRLLVMSATLDASPVAGLLNDAPVVVSEGRSFPVETRYLSRPPEGRIEPLVVRQIIDALSAGEGDILVFLPGAGEIRRVEGLLAGSSLGANVRVAPLYGQMPQEAQDRAVGPSATGERKIVLATSIAESSLTVEGVRIVVDSGLMRVPRFSPRTGMTRLETVPVSRASADQRRGRAGRLAPGLCFRLWTEQEERNLAPYSTPEILEADLAPLALELAAWGVTDPVKLAWLNPPPAAAYSQGRELLMQLGALDTAGAITAHGRRMAELGMTPRLAHMVLQALPLGCGGLACDLAALLSERDMLRFAGGAPESDLRLRVEALLHPDELPVGYSADSSIRQRVRTEAKQWKQSLRIPQIQEKVEDIDSCGWLLAYAYPDRIAQSRGGGRYVLSSGRGAAFGQLQSLAYAPYLVAAELDDQGAESRIQLAAPLDAEQLYRHNAERIVTEDVVSWDRGSQAVRARRRERLGSLVLRDTPMSNPDLDEVLQTLLAGITEEGLTILPWSKASKQLRQRMRYMHRYAPEWPDVSDAGLISTLHLWLAPHVYGMRSRDDLQRLKLTEALESMLSWSRRQALEEGVPTHIVVPSGSRIPVDYSDPDAPVLAVRLQELFGLRETPRIAGGKVPLVLHLLSPAQRPVQVTRDLASFWREAYFEIKKDLKGRYPKHYWPDDPLVAEPTHRAKPRSQA